MSPLKPSAVNGSETRAPATAKDHLLHAVATTVIPEAADLDAAGWAELDHIIAEALGTRPRSLQRRLRFFLHLIQWAALLRYRRGFASLDVARRARLLHALENHRVGLLRLGFWGLRALVMMGYYGQPTVARAIGYRPHRRGWDAAR